MNIKMSDIIVSYRIIYNTCLALPCFVKSVRVCCLFFEDAIQTYFRVRLWVWVWACVCVFFLRVVRQVPKLPSVDVGPLFVFFSVCKPI